MAKLESIAMEEISGTAAPVQPPRSEPIDIVDKRGKTVTFPRGLERNCQASGRWSMSTRRSHSKSTSSSDDDSSTASSKSAPSVVRPFSGEDSDRCVEDFVADIDSECIRLGWNGSTALEKVKDLLSGKAATVLVTEQFEGWYGLREKLLQRFGHRDALRHCFRLNSETVHDFRLRIEETAEREAIRVMIRSLRPDIARIVEDSKPETLMDAGCLAAFYETGGVDTEMHLLEGVRRLSIGPEIGPLRTPVGFQGLEGFASHGKSIFSH